MGRGGLYVAQIVESVDVDAGRQVGDVGFGCLRVVRLAVEGEKGTPRGESRECGPAARRRSQC